MLLRGANHAEIAALTGRSVSTVYNWTEQNGEDMPDTVLQLLKYKIADQ